MIRLILRRSVQVSPESGEWRHTTLDVDVPDLASLIEQDWTVIGATAGPESSEQRAEHVAERAITRDELFIGGKPNLVRQRVLEAAVRAMLTDLGPIGDTVTVRVTTTTEATS
jgi:hypothetical protein